MTRRDDGGKDVSPELLGSLFQQASERRSYVYCAECGSWNKASWNVWVMRRTPWVAFCMDCAVYSDEGPLHGRLWPSCPHGEHVLDDHPEDVLCVDRGAHLELLFTAVFHGR